MAVAGWRSMNLPSMLLLLLALVPCPALRPAIRVGGAPPPCERIPSGRSMCLRDLIPLLVEDPLSGRLRGGYVSDRSPSPGSASNSTLGLTSDSGGSNRVPPLSGLGERTSPAPDWSGDQDFVYSETHAGAKDGSPQSGSWSSSFTASSWVTDFSTQQDEERLQWGYSAVPPADGARVPEQPEGGEGVVAVRYAFVPPAWLMDRLRRLFEERHGRKATEEEVGEWASALVHARTRQEAARERGQEEDVSVHIAGVLVDMQTGKVATVKKRRPVGRSDRYVKYGGSRWQCFQEECPKRGSFLNPDKSSPQHAACREHAPQNFVSERVLGGHVAKVRRDGGNRAQRKRNEFSSSRCGFEGCTVSPSYGDIVAARSVGGTVMFCKQHKMPHHVNVRQPLCQHSSGCKSGALYGKAADRKKVRCFQHMDKGDVNLAASLCQYAGGCSKRAVYGPRAVGRPRHCSTHKMADDIDLVHKLCDFREGETLCDKQAGYGQPGGGSRRCRLHKGPDYVSLRKRNAHTHSHAGLPSSSDKEAQAALCCRCLSSTPAPSLRPPPTESFYFCMNTPWWSPRGPIPFDATYRQQEQQIYAEMQALPPAMIAQEGRVPSEFASMGSDVTFSGDSILQGT